MTIDGALGGLRFYRSLRGGVWEKWVHHTPEGFDSRWFGPFSAPYSDRCARLTNEDGAALSIVRVLTWQPGATDPPGLHDLAKPTLRCIGSPLEIEDHRPRTIVGA